MWIPVPHTIAGYVPGMVFDTAVEPVFGYGYAAAAAFTRKYSQGEMTQLGQEDHGR